MIGTRNLIPGKTYFAATRQRTLSTGFFDDACRDFYLRRLLSCQNAFGVQLHAYLLLEQEFYLLFTPLTPTGFDSFLGFLNRSYNRYYLTRFSRRVSVWQNEPALCLLPSDGLILDGHRFIERYVLDLANYDHPGRYRYSSYCANAFTQAPNSLQRHPVVCRFIRTGADGLKKYRDLIARPFRTEYERFLSSRLLWGRPLLQQRISIRLENNRALTDIEKSGTMAVSDLRSYKL